MEAQLRTLLVPAAILSAGALLGLAACSSGPASVEVSGTTSCSQSAPATAEWQYGFDCQDTMSDPRVSGTGRVDGIASSDGTVISGTYTVTNDQGTWTGEWSGVIQNDGTHVIDSVLQGTGAYEGWTYQGHIESADLSNATVTGTLVPPSG